ncbi:hypothetical protein CDL15_Pgr022336 [Punica granatum]|uniref:Uncharacterized protein n=1 Tax=Punica granatum TaxID=22663 RepID=A0A218Y2Q1_PUNGR|nr:hypothetical protein CDL15_Pgr022336 [Punica granatum]
MQSSLSGSGGMTKEEKDLLDRSVKCQMKLEMRGSSVEMEIEQVEKPEETSASPAIGAGPQIAQYSEALLENSTAPPVELGDVFFSKWEEDLAMIDFSNDIRPKILTTEEEISAWNQPQISPSPAPKLAADSTPTISPSKPTTSLALALANAPHGSISSSSSLPPSDAACCLPRMRLPPLPCPHPPPLHLNLRVNV